MTRVDGGNNDGRSIDGEPGIRYRGIYQPMKGLFYAPGFGNRKLNQ